MCLFLGSQWCSIGLHFNALLSYFLIYNILRKLLWLQILHAIERKLLIQHDQRRLDLLPEGNRRRQQCLKSFISLFWSLPKSSKYFILKICLHCCRYVMCILIAALHSIMSSYINFHTHIVILFLGWFSFLKILWEYKLIYKVAWIYAV